RGAAERHGFELYDAPVVETLDLLERKAGEEISEQIYLLEQKGSQRLALRAELTPSLARLIIARQGGLAFPLKWSAIAQCFRYERMQRGRKREHYQWNLDIVGEESVMAEAEVIGTAIALKLLFGIPLTWGICITALDVMLILFLQHRGFRMLEALVIVLIATIGACFLFEIVISRPDMAGVAAGFLPTTQILRDREMLYLGIGILGATVMPHNLYLHSSIVQTRRYEETARGKREAVKFAFLDSTIALSTALFINAAILVVAAATFHTSGNTEVAEIQDAYKLLTPLLGVSGASAIFALALLASGQNSTLTGTLAGQIVMEGFLNLRLRPWVRRLITRAIAIVPAVIVAILYGDSGTARLLILSQVILSLQLSFAVFPLVHFTSDRVKMGEFVNAPWLKLSAYTVAFVIAILNAWLLVQTLLAWMA
ncbi:MAG: Nramp family divalent metal transporter, partial [Gemmatimonadetes bacterium]|nr:Nramp family divalent metal transporter [Gemmatimonadota bacterium]